MARSYGVLLWYEIIGKESMLSWLYSVIIEDRKYTLNVIDGGDGVLVKELEVELTLDGYFKDVEKEYQMSGRDLKNLVMEVMMQGGDVWYLPLWD